MEIWYVEIISTLVLKKILPEGTRKILAPHFWLKIRGIWVGG